MGVLLLLLLLLIMIGCMVILCLSFTYMMSQRISAATLPELCPTDKLILIINQWIALFGKLREFHCGVQCPSSPVHPASGYARKVHLAPIHGMIRSPRS